MKIKIIKGADGIFAIYENFVGAPVFVKNENALKDAVIDETYRTCYVLERKPPKDCDGVEITSKLTYNSSVLSFDKGIFKREPLSGKEIKEFKNLYLQSAFSFKSLTDNLDENSREKAVKTYIEYVKCDGMKFGVFSDTETLMETAFSVIDGIDRTADCTEFLLTLNARLVWYARQVFNETDKKNDPFCFNA